MPALFDQRRLPCEEPAAKSAGIRESFDRFSPFTIDDDGEILATLLIVPGLEADRARPAFKEPDHAGARSDARRLRAKDVHYFPPHVTLRTADNRATAAPRVIPSSDVQRCATVKTVGFGEGDRYLPPCRFDASRMGLTGPGAGVVRIRFPGTDVADEPAIPTPLADHAGHRRASRASLLSAIARHRLQIGAPSVHISSARIWVARSVKASRSAVITSSSVAARPSSRSESSPS